MESLTVSLFKNQSILQDPVGDVSPIKKYLRPQMVLAQRTGGKRRICRGLQGVLRDGEKIAIKRLTRASNDERKEKEFLTEIGTIGHVSSQCVVSSRMLR
ncbi:hypothetical protein GH714_003260 [Hevea brasiliensis]|uniref:Protein kinase domain-containing protein n=1 Tax=Hevea brasiliensis TaxID=3981 RepID=A0A6A6MAG7_HEVBR|nr:hypothetical protein GH714_003260 [Hevea brasiliensis]